MVRSVPANGSKRGPNFGAYGAPFSKRGRDFWLDLREYLGGDEKGSYEGMDTLINLTWISEALILELGSTTTLAGMEKAENFTKYISSFFY